MIPSRGTCHGVFLLVHSARCGPRRSLVEWVSFAKSAPTVMAAAIDLDVIARALFDCGLASLDSGAVVLHEGLAALGRAATDDVLMMIASLLLAKSNPAWLHASTATGEFRPELVPSMELNALGWLGESLEPLLIGAKSHEDRDNAFKNWLGAVGEFLVVTTEQHIGATVRHVSLISDAFGYDIESVRDRTRRIEVKTSVVGTEQRLYLTRNEITVASRYRDEWVLIQVVLRPEALTATTLTREHVHSSRQLAAQSVIEVLPRDSEHCRWIETVELSTSNLDWTAYISSDEIPDQWEFGGASC